jgi:3-hydroxymyristoyl/3-hydroxydecanoyl-(acyl carrier protein) dehydratase
MVFQDYPGHFPGNGIVPGAVLLDAAVEVLSHSGIRLSGVRRVRFLEVVRPGEEVEVRWSRGEYGVSFELWGAGRVRRRGIGVEERA